MGITADFDHKQLEEYLQGVMERLDKVILRNLNYLGMECVRIAKTRNTYIDRTANLRNSIGYVIVKNGNVVKDYFKNDGRGVDWKPTDEKGENIGERVAYEIAQRFTDGYALIVVAGMHYAVYVEDVHHLDVLASAELHAHREAPKLIERLVKLK